MNINQAKLWQFKQHYLVGRLLFFLWGFFCRVTPGSSTHTEISFDGTATYVY